MLSYLKLQARRRDWAQVLGLALGHRRAFVPTNAFNQMLSGDAPDNGSLAKLNDHNSRN
jgi:hypothetical protein